MIANAPTIYDLQAIPVDFGSPGPSDSVALDILSSLSNFPDLPLVILA